MIRKKIANLVQEAIRKLQLEKTIPGPGIERVLIEKPREKRCGDYATNIALQITKQAKKKPIETAKMIAEKLKIKSKKLFEKIEVAEPGFVNFFLSREYLQKQVEEILKQGESFGRVNLGRGRKVQVEFISANPTGPLTVGNARGGPLGDVLGNVLKKTGYKVEKAYYVNDYGQQILVLGHSVLKDEKAQYKGDYINYLHKKIKIKDPYRVGEIAAKIIIKEMIKKTVKRLGINYDEWLWETEFHKSGAIDRVLKVLDKKGLIYKKENALWFKSSKYGDKRDRVVVKKDGSKTYLAGDIALHQYKFKKKKFNRVINIWGADHYGDVPGLQAGVEALGFKGKLDIILVQFVTVLEKGKKIKMSKRKGTLVTMDELLDRVPVDVVRFFFLQKSADAHLDFDLNLAEQQSEKNPVYYIQYAYARICSILRKCGKSEILNSKFETNPKSQIPNFKLLNHPSELNLIKELIKFPEIIEDTAQDYQVQRIPQYAIDLATVFHRFYRDCRVLTKDENLKRARLELILAAKIVLKNILDLMGVSAPEKM